MSKLKINGELDINSYLTAISDLYLSSADGASIIFRNGTTEAGRITSDGYLQLGGTSTGAYRLYVNGNSYFTGTNYLYGTTYGRYLYPSTDGSYSLGSSSYVWGSAYIRNLYIYDSTNNRSVGSFYVATQGTTSASGISRLTIGNSYSSGTAGNAYGVLRIYSTSSTYGDLRSSGGSVTHYLPSIGGTLLNTGNYNSYVPKLDGTGATGTWSINISGNAATATNAISAGSANSVAWTNITGKPSTFTPASHTHSYLPLSGGITTGSIYTNCNYPLRFRYLNDNAYLAANSNGIYLAVYGSSNSGKTVYLETYDTGIYHRKNGTNYEILTAANTSNIFKVYDRGAIGSSYNIDTMTINGLFEIRHSSEVTISGMGGPVNGWYPCLSMYGSNCRMQLAGGNSYGFWIRGKQGPDPALTSHGWCKLQITMGYGSSLPSGSGYLAGTVFYKV